MLLPLGFAIALVNLLTFAVMFIDKRAAIAGQYRIPENILWGAILLGGATGAWLAMHWVRHKIQKPLFRFGVPIIWIGQLLIVVQVISWLR